MSDHRAASGLIVLVLALVLVGCGSAPSASPIGALPASPTVSAAPSVTPSAAAAPTPVRVALPTPASCVPLGAYTVVAGDTLWEIANRHGLTVEDLLAANPQITDRRLIRPGDEITISPLYLGALGSKKNGSAHDINDLGQVVGWSASDRGAYGRAFLWQDGVMTDLGTLGGNMSSATAINDRGHVVGVSATADGTSPPSSGGTA